MELSSKVYRIWNDILVSIDNDAKCPFKGIGTIAFKSNGVTKNFPYVLYVPDIQRNMMFVEAITN